MSVWMAFLLFLACSGSAPEPKPVSTPIQPTALTPYEAEVADLAQVLGEVQVLDVRNRQDFQRAHLPGATNIPLASVDPRDEPIASWDRHRPVYVVDARGEHASEAARLVAAAGFEVYAVDGGMEAWVGDGLEGEGVSPLP